MMVLDHTGKGTLIETLPAAPTAWSEVATKTCYTPSGLDADPLDDDMYEQLMNAGALK